MFLPFTLPLSQSPRIVSFLCPSFEPWILIWYFYLIFSESPAFCSWWWSERFYDLMSNTSLLFGCWSCYDFSCCSITPSVCRIVLHTYEQVNKQIKRWRCIKQIRCRKALYPALGYTTLFGSLWVGLIGCAIEGKLGPTILFSCIRDWTGHSSQCCTQTVQSSCRAFAFAGIWSGDYDTMHGLVLQLKDVMRSKCVPWTSAYLLCLMPTMWRETAKSNPGNKSIVVATSQGGLWVSVRTHFIVKKKTEVDLLAMSQ